MSNAFILSQGLNFINPRVPSRRALSFLKSNTAAFLTAVKIGQLLRLGTNILTGSTRKKWSWWYKLRCYTRILSPGKSRKNTLEKVSFFFLRVFILPISCWHVTHLSRHSVRLMNERRSLHHSQSKVVLSNFFAKTPKNAYRLQTVMFKLS